MRWFKADSLFDTIRPIYNAAKVFGIFHDTIDFERLELKRCLWDQLYLVIAAFLDASSLYLALRRSSKMTQSLLLDIGFLFSINLGFALTLVIPLANRYHVGRIFRFFSELHKFDQEMARFGYRPNHQLQHFMSCVYMATPIVSNVLIVLKALRDTGGEDKIRKFNVFDAITFSRSSLLYTMFGSYVCLMLLAVLMRVRGLNAIISKHLPTSLMDDPLQCIEDTDVTVANIRKFSELHELLGDAIELFNRCFSLQILFALLAALSFTLFSIFALIYSFSRTVTALTKQVAVECAVYDLYYFAFTIQVVLLGSAVSSQCARTATVLHKAISYGRFEEKVLRQIKFFSQQLSDNTPTVSCRLFNLEWTLFSHIIKFLVTHLVILMQFDLADYSRCFNAST